MNYLKSEDTEDRACSWILILDCPWPARHVLNDPESGATGPSFAECAGCEHQKGLNFEIQDSDNLGGLQPFPERLQCGFK
jgi:hypothetical protein